MIVGLETLESLMSSPRMDLEKEWISIRIKFYNVLQ